MLSVPLFVDAAPQLLKLANGIPGIKQLANAVVRETFFKYFVGGDTVEETVPVIEELRSSGIGTLLGYSVEVDEEDVQSAKRPESGLDRRSRVPAYARSIQEMLNSIRVAGEVEDRQGNSDPASRKTWVALKLVSENLSRVYFTVGYTSPEACAPWCIAGNSSWHAVAFGSHSVTIS